MTKRDQTLSSLVAENAIRVPSGDQVGDFVSLKAPLVRFLSSPPSASMIQMSALASANAIRRPSGDQDGDTDQPVFRSAAERRSGSSLISSIHFGLRWEE